MSCNLHHFSIDVPIAHYLQDRLNIDEAIMELTTKDYRGSQYKCSQMLLGIFYLKKRWLRDAKKAFKNAFLIDEITSRETFGPLFAYASEWDRTDEDKYRFYSNYTGTRLLGPPSSAWYLWFAERLAAVLNPEGAVICIDNILKDNKTFGRAVWLPEVLMKFSQVYKEKLYSQSNEDNMLASISAVIFPLKWLDIPPYIKEQINRKCQKATNNKDFSVEKKYTVIREIIQDYTSGLKKAPALCEFCTKKIISKYVGFPRSVDWPGAHAMENLCPIPELRLLEGEKCSTCKGEKRIDPESIVFVPSHMYSDGDGKFVLKIIDLPNLVNDHEYFYLSQFGLPYADLGSND